MSNISSKLVNSVRNAMDPKEQDKQQDTEQAATKTPAPASSPAEKKPAPAEKPAPKKKKTDDDDAPLPKLPSRRCWPD